MSIDFLIFRRALSGLSLACALLAAGCAVPDRYTQVDHAKSMLVGLSEDDVTMCAGFPDRRQERENIDIWSYKHKTDGGNVNVSAPVLSGIANTSVNYSSGGNCSVQFLFVDGRVRRIAYAGDNDTASGRDMLCAPVIDDCMRYVAEAPRPLGAASAIAERDMDGVTAAPKRMPAAPPHAPEAREIQGPLSDPAEDRRP